MLNVNAVFNHKLDFPVSDLRYTLIIKAESCFNIRICRLTAPAGVRAFVPKRAYVKDYVISVVRGRNRLRAVIFIFMLQKQLYIIKVNIAAVRLKKYFVYIINLIVKRELTDFFAVDLVKDLA